MEPNPSPQPPTPGPNTLPAKGTADTQRAGADVSTNLPPPDSTPASAPPAAPNSEEDTTGSASETITEVPTDPTVASEAGPSGDADPGASNTSNDEPL
ncbi:hypothetical protein HMJ29_12805 [Hymenobacter taeanensis]|uniref:Uncharacterized protein n=1 Tax=Hymenobacter taeanensis TaxID=2735321 RepID=A0A6M6BIE7_9BACT|nr:MULTISPECIES: hypothetical protein [Hymenobacter]QJX47772.1 hypothetical protein HMJ29_12805 [Hymenobacter taeanensis]UOQ82739.1 hypothetical protein MUN83_08260 [Hymenobacter sp. 5414T-23]